MWPLSVILVCAPCQPVMSFLYSHLATTRNYSYMYYKILVTTIHTFGYLEKKPYVKKSSFFRLLQKLLHDMLPMHLSLQHVHRQMVSNSQYTLPPQSSLQKSTRVKSKIKDVLKNEVCKVCKVAVSYLIITTADSISYSMYFRCQHLFLGDDIAV